MVTDPTPSTLRIAVPPGLPRVHMVGAGSYSAPAMWDDYEWASPTPCHLRWIVLRRRDFAVLGRLEATCTAPGCGKVWDVIWDPWRSSGRGHAIWLRP